jgi:hypothetical protein
MSKISMVTAIAVAGILTLSVLAAISLTNQVFAQEKPTQLTIKVSPDIVGESSYQVTGRLTSEGEGLDGTTITFTWSMGNSVANILSPTQTNSDGFYGVTGSIPYPIDNVIAHYAGDSEHMPAQSEAFLKYATPPNH